MMLALCVSLSVPPLTGGGDAPSVPVATASPVMTMPTGLIGDTISVDNGTWSGEPDSYEYRLWVDGVLTSETSSTFVLTSAEAGLELYYEVRAHNALGWSAWVASNTETTMALTAPVTQAAPELDIGEGLVGLTISVSNGDWSGEPDSFEYRLYVDGVLTEVTSNTFVLTSAEAGLELYYEVRAHNALGWSAWVASNTETTIALTAPFAVAAPVITDVGFLDYSIVIPAVWGGNPPSVTESFQWWEIYDGWSEWQPISGSNSSYLYADSHSGATTKCQVIATNGVSPDAEVYSNEIVVPS